MKTPSQTEAFLGKEISNFITPDTRVLEDGTVKGTLKKVEGFKEFNLSNVAEQSGYYFPLTLTKSGSTMTLKNSQGATKTGIKYDKDLLFRVNDSNATVKIEIDSQPYITLNFKKAKFAS